MALALLVMIVIGRTALPAPRQTTTGACPGRGLASADTAAAAVGEPRQASTRLMWLPSGTSPAHASPILPSICSRSMCTATYSSRAGLRHRHPIQPHLAGRRGPDAAGADAGDGQVVREVGD